MIPAPSTLAGAPSPDAAPRSPTAAFIDQVLRAPFATGAVAPSSRRLARTMVALARVEEASRVIELGPGTGVVTREILARKRAPARVLSLERNASFARGLEQRYPEVIVVQDCASRIDDHARRHGFSSAQSIISSLPWTVIEPDQQAAILHRVAGLLDSGGVFATFACFGLHRLPRGAEFRRLLGTVFSRVERSRVVLRNVPPAFVYYCGK